MKLSNYPFRPYLGKIDVLRVWMGLASSALCAITCLAARLTGAMGIVQP